MKADSVDPCDMTFPTPTIVPLISLTITWVAVKTFVPFYKAEVVRLASVNEVLASVDEVLLFAIISPMESIEQINSRDSQRSDSSLGDALSPVQNHPFIVPLSS